MRTAWVSDPRRYISATPTGANSTSLSAKFVHLAMAATSAGQALQIGAFAQLKFKAHNSSSSATDPPIGEEGPGAGTSTKTTSSSSVVAVVLVASCAALFVIVVVALVVIRSLRREARARGSQLVHF